MARRGLSETYVTEAALLHLERIYRTQRHALSVQRKTEAWIRAKRGRRYRADGLVIWVTPDGEIRTASLEAKSRRTKQNVKVRYANGLWLLQGLLFASVVGLLCWRVTMGMDHWALKWFIPFAAAIGAGLAELAISAELGFKSLDIVRQIRRYPADEQWLALSGDLYNHLGETDHRELQRYCHRYGLGIMVVKRQHQVTIERYARSKKHRPKNGFLGYYTGIDSLVELLENDVSSAQHLDCSAAESAATAE